MSTSRPVGRPKIEGLTSLNARILGTQLAALDTVVAAEQKRRNDPGFTRTSALREAVAAYIDAKRPGVW